MSAELFDWLLRSALALAIAACLVMALRPLWRRWLGAGAVLWLYLLLPASLLATSLPGPTVVVDAPVLAASSRTLSSSLPVEAATHSPARRSVTSAARVFVPADPASTVIGTPGSLNPAAPALPRGALAVGLLTWAAGAFALAGWLLVQQRRFRRRLGRLQRREGKLWQASADDIGPVVIGLLRPRIIVPADFERRYDAQQRELVLAHERVHLRRGDLPVNALACALRCLFWFNPLVHLAAAKLRLDQELACDAAVLAQHPHAGRAYATALLNTQLADLGLPVGCAWQSSHPLTWRISMLKKPLPGPARLMLGAGLAVLASSAGAAALWQQQPATVVTLPAVSLAAAAAPLPPLAVQGRLPAPAPARLPSLATVATAAPAAPPEALRPMAAPAPVVAKAATPVAARAPIAGAAPAAVPAVAPVAPKAEVSTGRAPLPAPLKAQRIYDYSQNPPLPPPPMPRPEPALPAPQVVLDPSDNPGADAAGYEAPRVLVAKMAQRPLLARSSLAGGQVQGMVMQVKLDAEGKPTEAVVHGNSLGPVYERNALKAVKRWRFEPARRAGEAVPATVLATVWFLNADRSTSIQAQSLSHPLPRNMQPPQAIASQ